MVYFHIFVYSKQKDRTQLYTMHMQYMLDLSFQSKGHRPAVLNLWAAAHWWAVDLCLVGRDQGSESRNFFDMSRVWQSMKRYQVLVVALELPLHT